MFRVLFICITAVFFGCHSKTISIPAVPSEPPLTDSWHQCAFKLEWPKGKDPNWGIDLVLADQVIEPVLDSSGARLPFWRFHRRAVRDNSGHKFDFVFYASAETAAAIEQGLKSSAVLGALLKAGIVAKYRCYLYEVPKPYLLAATSDPSWPPELQRAWPWYIMGVSAVWLDLINSYAAPPAGADARALVKHYAEVSKRIDLLWGKSGQHAFLHHLSAMFGYAPIEIKRALVF